MEETKKNEIPVITEETLKDARIAIESGKESNSLDNAELVEELVEKLKGRNMKAASEIFLTVALIIDPVILHHHIEYLRGLCALKALKHLSDLVKDEETTDE